jgi:hypothetical protein
MYVRTKIVKGHTYYQIVEGIRDSDKVRQRVVLSLGRGVPILRADDIVEGADLPAMLGLARRRLAGMREQRRFAATCVGTSKARERRLARLDGQIGVLTRKAEVLASIIKKGLLGTREELAEPEAG